ncbi:hypothetical protein HPB49_026612 [Dermacentor silvarum]|nr:hypothetical protein HPB49_026612 [Dermacentor silvarum]
MAANAKKRTTLTFAAKLEAIQRIENDEKKSSEHIEYDSTGTTAELTDVEIVAKVTAEQPNENAAEMDPASADDAPLPTSAEVIAALALVRRHCGAIEGTVLSLVDRLDYIEDAVVKHAIANKKQATLFQYFKPTQ